MTRAAIPTVLALLLLPLPAAGALAAPLDLPGGCAVSHAATLRASGAGLDADRVTVILPGMPGVALHATHLHAAGLPAPALGRAATAAAAVLLAGLSGHRDGACPDDELRDAARPLSDAANRGGHVALSWSGVSVAAGDTRFGARQLALRLAGTGGTARLDGSLDGAVSNGPAAGLLPEALSVQASLPADRLPDLLSATGGHGGPVDVSIAHLEARRGETRLSGAGHAVVAATPQDSRGTGHLSAQNYPALIDAATAAGLARLRTGLFLAQLVAHRRNDTLDWDLAWQQGVLTVNTVPIPLR